MKLNSFEDLFVCLLSDIYEVENQIVKDIPVLMKRAYSDELKDALRTHLDETKEQVKRLDNIFRLIKQQPKRVEWASDVKNLFADAGAFLQENNPSPLLDAAIIAIAQRIEHFEIATYGTLREFAKVLDYDEVEDILDETIKEEGHADKLLTKLAEGGMFKKGINIEAAR
jgi:ferritin-like metal-binding protein YciE